MQDVMFLAYWLGNITVVSERGTVMFPSDSAVSPDSSQLYSGPPLINELFSLKVAKLKTGYLDASLMMVG